MKNALYMKVTRDEFETPLIVADSVKELAEKDGVSPRKIFSAISHSRKLGYCSGYVRVDFGTDD